MRRKGGNNVEFAGTTATHSTLIIISLWMSKVKLFHVADFAALRDCPVMEATPAAQHACALHCHKRDLMPTSHVSVRWVTASLLSKIAK